jgi:hypothetical protein
LINFQDYSVFHRNEPVATLAEKIGIRDRGEIVSVVAIRAVICHSFYFPNLQQVVGGKANQRQTDDKQHDEKRQTRVIGALVVEDKGGKDQDANAAETDHQRFLGQNLDYVGNALKASHYCPEV